MIETPAATTVSVDAAPGFGVVVEGAPTAWLKPAATGWLSAEMTR